MKKIIALIICLSAFVSTNANAWFFFFLPGSVTGAISDAVTGSEGSNCVGPNAKVGDNIRTPTGVMTVKSLSGTSSRCTQPEFPIRALLEPSNTANTPNANVTLAFNSKAGIELPDGWEQRQLSDNLKKLGFFFHATNRTIDAGLTMAGMNRAGITDVMELAKSRKRALVAALEDGNATEFESITVKGMTALRFEASGKLRQSRQDYSYLVTLIDGGTELIEIKAYILTTGFQDHRNELAKIAYGITGLEVPVTATATKEETTPPVVAEKTPNSSDTVATRLKELNNLYKDGLITEKDFESKKQEILKSL